MKRGFILVQRRVGVETRSTITYLLNPLAAARETKSAEAGPVATNTD